jgi:hypothetical protein
MFRKMTLLLTAIASLTIANAYAVDPAFYDRLGGKITQIPQPLTIEHADQSSIRAHWVSHSGRRSGQHEATFYLTNKTTFSGGSRSDAVKGRKVHITYHFEGDRAIADTITFV